MKLERLSMCLVALLASWVACHVQSASASCTLISGATSFPIDQPLNGPPKIADVDAALPLGSILASVFVHETDSFNIECLPTIGSLSFSIVGSAAAYGSVSSGIPGIGLKLIGPEGRPMPYEKTVASPTLFNTPTSYRLQLIKIGDIPQGGVLPEWLFESYIPPHNNLLLLRGRLITPIQVTVRRVPTCLVEQPDINIGFPESNPDALSGPVLQAVNFNIQLRCDGGSAGVRVPLFVTLSDAVSPGNRSNTLTLSSASTASGVGVRVLFRGTPVLFGPYIVGNGSSRVRMGSAANGLQGIPLTAELVKTGAVKMGHFAASSTFTIDYK